MKSMKNLWVLVLAALLQACGGGGDERTTAPTAGSGAQSPQSCSVADQRQQLREFMDREYFWAARTPDESAPTMAAYFQSMLNTPVDRFSFSEPTSTYEAVFGTGLFTGYGYSLIWVDGGTSVLRVQTVEPQGPAAAAGLKRGDTVLSIDGLTVEQVAGGAVASVTTEGVQRVMRVRDFAGAEREIRMVSATFALTPVRTATVLDATRDGQPVKVGYLDYNQFVAYSVADLTSAVSRFAAEGATELVLDLRYNGGGDVATSRDLASLVAGATAAGRVFAGLRYNAANQAKNHDYLFNVGGPSVPGLARVFIIASGSTASASELLINGLQPFLPVVLIGETTYGKPYGFVPFSNCGTTYNAVNFETVNSAGTGSYTTGFAPTCTAPDDLSHALGDPAETRLKTALGYIASGQCPQVPQSAALPRTVRIFGDGPRPGMFTR